MIKIEIKNQKGFTLMETLIYIALFGIIMAGAVVGTYNLLEGGNRNINSAKIEEEGTFINRKINWAISGATGAVVSGGGTKITITKSGLSIVIAQTGTNMTIARNAGAPIELNNDRFKISNTSFSYQPASNGRPASISASFDVENKTFTYRNYLRQ